MKGNVVLLLSALGLISGCGITPNKAKPDTIKAFYNRTITFKVNPQAQELMGKLESLVAQAQELNPPIPDKIILPLYRDADIDRNHIITAEEAQTFYQNFIIKFEDSLGAISYTQKNNDPNKEKSTPQQ